MIIKFQSAVIITRKFDILKEFYTNILKQEIEFDFGNCIGLKGGLSIWELKDNYTITQKLDRKFSNNGNNNLEFSFETENLDEVVENLQSHDIKYLHNVIEESWGQRTIRFYDPENNLIEIGETLKCFIKRFHNQGLAIEEISNKTSVSIDNIVDLLLDIN